MTDRTISTDRQGIRREDDDELLGFVSCAGDFADPAEPAGRSGAPLAPVFRAETVFGGLLGEHADADDAERQVRESGLSSLAERWWVRLDGQWERCHLIEASPDRVVAVVATYAWEAAPRVIAPGTPLQLAEPADLG